MNLPPKLNDTDTITTSISHSAPSLLSLISKVSAVAARPLHGCDHTMVSLLLAVSRAGFQTLYEGIMT